MKKVFLFLMFCLLSSTQLNAQESNFGGGFHQYIIFTIQSDNHNPIGHPTPKSPEDPPLVYQEENVLYFDGDHPGYVLTLKDEDGDTVYTTTVNSTDMVVTLPSTLSGDYEIELVMGNWLFTGWINL